MRLPYALLLASPAFVSWVSAATTIFQGLQSVVFPYDTPTACLASFNLSIRCDPVVSLLYMQTNWVGWNATNLTAFVTTAAAFLLTNIISSLT
jgi:hypothetical protein